MTRALWKTLLSGCTLGLLILGADTTAQAGITVNLISQTPVAGGNAFTYEITQATGDVFRSGDYVGIVDFGPVVGTPTATFSASFLNEAQTPLPAPISAPLATDSSAIQNVRVTNSGGTISTQLIGDVTIVSPFSNITIAAFVSNNSQASGPLAGRDIGSFGPLVVPTAIPEPSTMLMAGLALPALLLTLRRRRPSA